MSDVGCGLNRCPTLVHPDFTGVIGTNSRTERVNVSCRRKLTGVSLSGYTPLATTRCGVMRITTRMLLVSSSAG